MSLGTLRQDGGRYVLAPAFDVLPAAQGPGYRMMEVGERGNESSPDLSTAMRCANSANNLFVENHLPASPPQQMTLMTEAPQTTPTESTPADARPALPDHLSVDPRSRFHVAAVFEHDIGIRLNGVEKVNVEEYCISEGWVKVPAGKTVDRKGQPLLIKIKGQVEAYYR